MTESIRNRMKSISYRTLEYHSKIAVSEGYPAKIIHRSSVSDVYENLIVM